jgi:hypothetical protein
MGGGKEESPKPRQLLLLEHQPGPTAAPAPPLHLIPLQQLARAAARELALCRW